MNSNGFDKIDLTTINEDEHVMIRGYPRKREKVEYVEQLLGGTLLSDKQPELMRKLDIYLFNAKMKTGKYPEYIAIPSEPFALFVPIPFEVNFYGLIVPSWKKPAWFRIKRHKVVTALPWK